MSKLPLAVLSAAALVAALAGRLASRPALERIERSALVGAAPEVVAAQLTDPRRWAAWSPWDRGDAAARWSFGGPVRGAGASAYWPGDRAGQGRMTVVLATASRVEVEREEPSGSSRDLEFTLEPAGSGTRLRWAATREVSQLGALARRLWPALDRGLPREMESGLARLVAVAEAEARPATWRVERSIRVAAAPAALRERLLDPRSWAAASPWGAGEKVQRRCGGPVRGVGASCYWSGSGEAGRGRLTLVQAGPGALAAEVELAGPAPSLADLELRLEPDGGGTRLTGSASGAVEVRGEVMGRPGDPEATLGPALERGLARLRAEAEAEAGSALAGLRHGAR